AAEPGGVRAVGGDVRGVDRDPGEVGGGAAGRAQGREKVAEGPLELLGAGVAGDPAVGVEGGLAREEHHAGAGRDDGVREPGGRGQLGRVDALGGHRASRSPAWAYNSLAMMPRWTSLAPS